MAEKKFGQGILVGSLVGLGVGVASTCVAAALMSDDESEPEIEDQEDVQTKDSENEAPGFISSIIKAVEKAGEAVSDNAELKSEKATNDSETESIVQS